MLSALRHLSCVFHVYFHVFHTQGFGKMGHSLTTGCGGCCYTISIYVYFPIRIREFLSVFFYKCEYILYMPVCIWCFYSCLCVGWGVSGVSTEYSTCCARTSTSTQPAAPFRTSRLENRISRQIVRVQKTYSEIWYFFKNIILSYCVFNKMKQKITKFYFRVDNYEIFFFFFK